MKALLMIPVFVAALFLVAPGERAWASGHGAPAQHGEEDGENSSTNWRIYDLGEFEIKEVLTTRKKTNEINFNVYFLLSEEVGKAQVKKLEHWKNRLRDQVITAVRTAKSADFQEPDLERLRRIIMFRIRRLLNEDVVKDVLVSKFTIRTE